MVTITGTTSANWTFALDIYENSTDAGANTSDVTVKVFIGRSSGSGSYMYGANISGKVSVTGCEDQSFSYNNANKVTIAAGGWLQIASLNFPKVPHNSDGSKTVTISASFSNNVAPSSGSASGSVTLTTIPRASKPSCITWPEHTKNVGDFGDTISIHMNRKSNRFTHTVGYAYGKTVGTCINAETGKAATDIETGFKWKIPESFMDIIPNADKGEGQIWVDTYDGTKYVGREVCVFIATVPDSVKPTVSVTLEDTTGVDDIYGSPVAGLSKIKVTPSVTKAHESPIASIRITIDGATHIANTVTTDFLQNSGPSKVKVTATDKRGRSGSWEYTMNVQAYTRPQVSQLAVHRTNGDWEEADQGDHVMVTLTATVDPMNNKNQANYTLRYKKTTETSWQTIDLSEVDNNFNLYNYAVLFEADIASSYDVELTAADRHHSTTRATSASTAFSLMDWHSSGTGIAFGKVAERANTMQVGLDAEFEKEIYFKGKKLAAFFLDFFYPINSIYISYSHDNPKDLFGGTWVRIENQFLWATTSGGIIGRTGGEQTHTLTIDEMPSHKHNVNYRHSVTGFGTYYADLPVTNNSGTEIDYGINTSPVKNAGGGAAHNNMPPYIQVSIWRRTA